MEKSGLTARQMYEALKAKPPRRRIGFGERAALVNVDLQKAYTAVGEFTTAYQTDHRQLEHVNRLAAAFRASGWPVVWTFVAYSESGEDCGVWGTRSDTPDSLQNIRLGSRRAEFDDRLQVDRSRDVVMQKRMASAFFETNLPSLLTFRRVDTVVVTGGSTSGCVRATVVDSLSHGYRTVVPEECVADKHDSPHFASLYDIALKYADVMPVDEVLSIVERRRDPASSPGVEDPGFPSRGARRS